MNDISDDEIMALYENLRKESLSWASEPTADETGQALGARHVLHEFNLDRDNFPEDAVTSDEVGFLLSAIGRVSAVLRSPLPPATDGLAAGIEVTRRYIFGLSMVYLSWTAAFLACDRRFNPGDRIQCDVIGILQLDMRELEERLKNLSQMLAVLCPMRDRQFPGDSFAPELRTVQLAAGLFFNVLETVFALPSIGKCRMGFDRFMQAVGTHEMCAATSNCLRRHHTMFRDIRDIRNAKGPHADARAAFPDALCAILRELPDTMRQIQDGIGVCTANVAQIGRNVKRMDRRQSDALKGSKELLKGFVRLFRPGRPTPTREQVAAQFFPNGRYGCLSRIAEPHRSQVKAVIDHTWADHPIVFGDRHKDVYTLASAVRDVWLKNEAKWRSVPGTFVTEKDLYAACHNIAQKEGEGVTFNYRK